MLADLSQAHVMTVVGLCACRNDWSILTKTLANEVLRLAIKERNPEGALQHLRQQLVEMRAGRLDIKNFVISKQLHSYTPKTKSAHVNMCKRIKQKDPAAAPVLGTKVSYVLYIPYSKLLNDYRYM